MQILKYRIRNQDIKIRIPAFAICNFQQLVIGIPAMDLESVRKRLVAACIKGMRIFDDGGNTTMSPQGLVCRKCNIPQASKI